jgi:hypothetical protein
MPNPILRKKWISGLFSLEIARSFGVRYRVHLRERILLLGLIFDSDDGGDMFLETHKTALFIFTAVIPQIQFSVSFPFPKCRGRESNRWAGLSRHVTLSGPGT